MSRPGIGAMLGMMTSNEETVDNHNAAKGKKIKSLRLDHDYNAKDGGLEMIFDDGSGIVFYDDARSCCEHRYVHTDDNLDSFIGATFVGADLKEGPEVEEDYEVHEIQFLIINTSVGQFTVETHNEHNGYYGGFVIRIEIYKGENDGN